MSGTILDGKKIATQIRDKLKKKVAKLQTKPTLAIVLVGEEPASEIYVRRKEAAAREIGCNFRLIQKPTRVGQIELEKIVETLNKDRGVSGIVVQQPLPKQIEYYVIDCLVDPSKDVDGLNPASPFIPATSRGIFELLDSYKIKIEGKKVVVVGRSKLVGLPTALEFLNRGATITICHSKTRDLATETRQADILVVAVGKPGLIKANMVKPGAVVIDVGINRIDNAPARQASPGEAGGELIIQNSKKAKTVTQTKLVGDVDFESVKKVASFITPVPGGVGPMTVAGLLSNLVEA